MRALKARGVTTIFSLPGAAILPIYDACITHGIRIIDGRHEAAVVQMAECLARTTREPGVAVLPEGPGLANGIGGIAAAYAEFSPVLVLSAIPPVEELGRGARQELPQVEMCAPITKLSKMVAETARITEVIPEAFDLTMSGVPGPVHLSIPADVLEATVAISDLAPTPPPSTDSPACAKDIPEQDIDSAIGILAEAQRPAIVAGSMVYWADAGAAVQEFVELTGIPLFTVERARGLIPDSHPLCFGDGYSSVNGVAMNLSLADAVLLLGERVDNRFAFGRLFGQASLIHVWPEANEIGLNREAAVGLSAPMARVVAHLIETAHGREWQERAPWVARLRSALALHTDDGLRISSDSAEPLHPLYVANVLKQQITDDTLLVFDGGDVSGWARRIMEARLPGDWQLSTIIGQMGLGLPYALGAASNGTPVVLLTGDGAMGFSVAEFETAVRHNIPVTVVIANDAAWGIEQHFQRALYGEDRMVATKLGDVRWDRVVEAMGGHGEFVEKADDLAPALERALAYEGPACVNVKTRSTPSPLARVFTRLFRRERAKAREG